MSKYTGIISFNTDGQLSNSLSENYIKVRIPYLHGPKTKEDYADSGISSEFQYYTPDSDLPWAHILKPISATGEFLPDQYFQEDEVVLIEAVNDDLNNLVVIGKLGNYTATSDSQLVLDRINGTATYVGGYGGYGESGTNGGELPEFQSGSSLISIARSQLGVHDDGNNNVKYNTEYYGKPVSSSNYAWCCAFVWWCFKHANLSQYFYGGNKTARCQTLREYHNGKGEGITSNYKAGDILFFNWSGDKSGRAQHVGIAIEEQKGNKIKTIEGNTNGGTGNQSTGGHVMEKNRDLKYIIGGYRPGKSTSNEQQCFEYFTKTMNLNVAAACGIMGNIYYESVFKTTAIGDHGTSYGICQWHNGRYDNLKKWCAEENLDYTRLLSQLQYLNHELNTSYQKVLTSIRAVLNTSDGAYNAASIWCKKFEVPANADNEVKNKRGPKAIEYFKKYNV